MGKWTVRGQFGHEPLGIIRSNSCATKGAEVDVRSAAIGFHLFLHWYCLWE
jgi:hypothetical protein